jgi:hypothetical protein
MTDGDPRDPTPRPGDGTDGRDAGDETPDPVDELASAVLDGEIGGDEAQTALRRPEVAARVAQLAAVRDAVASPVPPPAAARRDTAISAALDAFADGGATTTPGMPVARDDLAAARAARAERRARATRWLGAAAALIIVVVLGLALAQLGGQSGDDAETASDAANEEAERSTAAGGDDAGAETQAGGDGDATADKDAGGGEGADDSVALEDAAPEATARELGGVPLGAFASAEGLLDAVAGDLDTLRDNRAAGDPAAFELLQDRCGGDVPAAVAGPDGDPWPVAWGTVDGTRVEAWSSGTGDDAQLVALDSGCSVLATRPAP